MKKATQASQKLSQALHTTNTTLREKKANALGGGGLLDDNLRKQHSRLTSLHAMYGSVLSTLKHQNERALKTAKTLHETVPHLRSLHDALPPAQQATLRSSLAVEEALACAWDEYSSILEHSVLAPARAEIGALFSEGEALYSSYLTTVNDLAAKQSKEKLSAMQQRS